jgi:hypothetical protein
MEENCHMCGRKIWGEDIYMLKAVRVYHYNKEKDVYEAEETLQEEACCSECYEKHFK